MFESERVDFHFSCLLSPHPEPFGLPGMFHSIYTFLKQRNERFSISCLGFLELEWIG